MKKNIAILLFIAFTLSLFADENRYINFFIGDRAAGLGGAYTAIADGPEGVFYNPAGLAFSSSKYFSLSVNAIQYKMLYYHDVFKKTDGTPFDYVRHSFSFIPNFFGFVQKAKKFTFALTVSSPDSEFYDQRDNAEIKLDLFGEKRPARLNVNYNFSDMTYDIGPSLAFLLHKKVSFGFNVFFRYRDKKLISQTTYLHESEFMKYFQTGSFYKNEKIFGMKPQLGIQIMPTSKLSIGYSISTPFDILNVSSYQSTDDSWFKQSTSSPTLINIIGTKWVTIEQMTDSDGNIITTSSYTLQDNKYITYNLAENGLFRPLFINQSLGIAYFINKSALVTFDANLYIPIQMSKNNNLILVQWNKKTNSYDTFTLDQNQSEIEKINIVGNFAAGLEYYITPNFPLRIGAYTNLTNTPEIKDANNDNIEDNGKTNMKDYIHLFGGSMSIGFATSDITVNLGAAVSGGYGKAQILGDSTVIQNITAVTVNLFLSGGYQF
ncbi:MAG: hypothetical protein A2015_00920 [Spirochaetes bacterium GWF1_31_7]|nr:MAG: hypothetical protein A2Y30_12780 [Spirochaetes bacterium GWE1_32_154]OHD51681.1 MAG: hypothetical protein A2Y29_04580 [Spirochaetes bacterium GWE2_31_10]OHD51933.1 MAG: hypothetical protein A2015_00920 [Spirochaetes bacterium GWF1_31_7]OHD76093.1 MAG: hypothetical protein A2355_10070 [Spirochaetes bacterium RIFOXYB1_FULL_32_8]HBD93018.1 hypothetical protein [Spirochaetia bacterium]